MIETASPRETAALGRRIGGACGPGTLLALCGDLGAGKTRFVKGVATGAGVPGEDTITSPTFVLMNLYPGRYRVAHFDLYRLDTPDLVSVGFHDLRDDALVLIEWAQKAPERILGDHVRVTFEVTGPTRRRLSFQPRGPRSLALLQGLNLYP